MKKQFADSLPESWEQATRFFAALGDPCRQKILLLFEPGEELCVNQISSAFTLSRPAVSHHLKVLRDAQLLKCEKRGKEIYYRVNYEHCLEVLTTVSGFVAGRTYTGADGTQAETTGSSSRPTAASW